MYIVSHRYAPVKRYAIKVYELWHGYQGMKKHFWWDSFYLKSRSAFDLNSFLIGMYTDPAYRSYSFNPKVADFFLTYKSKNEAIRDIKILESYTCNVEKIDEEKGFACIRLSSYKVSPYLKKSERKTYKILYFFARPYMIPFDVAERSECI